jgi:hypothetical protein
MTTVTERPTDVRRTDGFWFVALLMPIGPLAVGVLRLLLPGYNADTPAAQVASAAAHPGRESAVLWLAYVAALTLVPGVLALTRLIRAASPRLTTWAVALVVPAYLSIGGLTYSNQVLWSGPHGRVAPAASAIVLDTVHPTVNISIGVFIVGHVVGTVLLGIALLRSGRVPAWAGWSLTVSQPLHFASVILGSPQMDMVGWSLTAVAMAMAARALLHGPCDRDEEANPRRSRFIAHESVLTPL